MNKKFTLFLLIILVSAIFNTSKAQILISGFMANPAGNNDAPYEYVQLIATQTINFGTSPYSVVWANNGTATSVGWIQGGTVTYGFDLTSGTVNKGDVFYVGGDGKMINGTGSTSMTSEKWIRAINTSTTTGDGFGTNGNTGQMGNGGFAADGLAIFAGRAQNLTTTSIPVDAVFYGTTVGTAKPATGGYTIPDNDHYSNSQGTYGNGTNTFMLPSPTAASSYIKLLGTYFPSLQKWDVIRTGRLITLTATSPLSTIATGIILDDPKPGIYLSATTSGPSYITQNSTNNILHAFRIEVKNMAAILDTLKINLKGTFIQADIDHIKLIYSQDSIYQSYDSIIKSISIVNSGVLSFNNLAFGLDSASIGYLLIAVDINVSANSYNTIYVDNSIFSDFIFRSAKMYGSQPFLAGGVRTIIPSGSANIITTYLKDFGSVNLGTTSAEQVFTVSGYNLSPASGSIMIRLPNGSPFLISFTSGSGYSSTFISKSYSSSTLSPVNVYVVFKPAGYYTVDTTILIGGGSANTMYVPVKGTGICSDHTAPVVSAAYATSLTTVKVVFSEPVSNTAEILTNYQMTNGILTVIHTASLDTVYLSLKTALTAGVASNLQIMNIQDTSFNHNAMAAAQMFQIRFGQIILKEYNIKDVTGINATTGAADSLNVYCRLRGVIQSQNFSQNVNNSAFYIHDNTDGIRINRVGAVPVFNVRRGDKIRAMGRIQQNNGLTTLTTDSIVVEDSLQQQQTPTLSAKLNEATESEVIRINNLRLINTLQWPVTAGATRNVSATNGIDTFTITIFTRCNIQGTPVPTSLFDITGLGSQTDNSLPYTSGYTIWPRDLNDLFIHPPYPTYTIAEVHNENSTTGIADSNGIYCKLIGIVHGINESSTGLSFTIIDKTGGIKVYNSINTNPPYTVTEGDEVAVIGTIQQYSGLTEIFPDTIQLIASGQTLFAPQAVDLLDETTESKLVQVKNLSIVPPSQWPITPVKNIVDIEVTNGAHNYMIRINKNCDIQGTNAPDGKFDVTGIGSQYDPTSPYTDNYYIVPRYKTDISKSNSIKETEILNKVSLFPNPSNGTFYIQNGTHGKLIIEVFNTFGQSIFKTNSVLAIQKIDLSTEKGLYMVKVTDPTTSVSKTIKVDLK
jgi:hypothetical protein